MTHPKEDGLSITHSELADRLEAALQTGPARRPKDRYTKYLVDERDIAAAAQALRSLSSKPVDDTGEALPSAKQEAVAWLSSGIEHELADRLTKATGEVFGHYAGEAENTLALVRITDLHEAVQTLRSQPSLEDVAEVIREVIVSATAPDDGLELKTLVGVTMKAALLTEQAARQIKALYERTVE